LDKRDRALARLEDQMRSVSPLRRIQSEFQRVDELSHRSGLALAHLLELSRARLRGLGERLEALSPLAVLKRGYAVVTRLEDGSVVRSVRQVKGRDALTVKVADGAFDVEVKRAKADG
jgi:exonuclease VII large subunit